MSHVFVNDPWMTKSMEMDDHDHVDMETHGAPCLS